MSQKKSKTPTFDEIAAFHSAYDRIEGAKNNFLRKRGWEFTSATPGSIWLCKKTMPTAQELTEKFGYQLSWFKECGGLTLLVDVETAIRVEQELCGEQYDSD